MIRIISDHELIVCHDIIKSAYAYDDSDRGRSIAYEDLFMEYKSGHMFFLSEKEGKFIGMLRLEQREDYLIIKDIAVRPKYHNKGYGTELIEFAKAKSKELGATKVGLGFFDDNLPLRRWYKSLGFTSKKTFQFDNNPDPNHTIRIMEYML